MIRAEAASRRQQKKQSYVEPQTQYSEKLPSSSSQEEGTWFEIKEIVAEKRTSYRIAWEGEDPATGQPWKREWKPKIEVTEDAIKEWEWKKQVQKEVKKHTRQSNIGAKRKRGRPCENSSPPPPPPSQSSEYVPSQEFPEVKRLKSEPPFPEEIEDTFAFSQFSEISLIPEAVPRGVLVTIDRPQGFDRDQYTIFADSNIEGVDSDLEEESPIPDQTQGFLTESPEKRTSLGEIPSEQINQTRNFETLTQNLARPQQIIETFEKELSSQGSSGTVILVYERTAVIPDSQGVSPSSLSRSEPSLELSSSQEQRIPETQAEAEAETEEAVHSLEELQVVPFVSQESIGAQAVSLSDPQEHNPRETAVSSENILEPQTTQILLGESRGIDSNTEETANKQVKSGQRFPNTLEPAQHPSAQPESPQTTQGSDSTSAEFRDLKDLQISGDLQEPPHLTSIRSSEEPHLPSVQEDRSILIRELPDECYQQLELFSLPEHSTREGKAILSTSEVTATNPHEISPAICEASEASEVGSAHVPSLESPDWGTAAAGIEPQVLAPRQVHESAGNSNQTTSIPLVEPPYLLRNTIFRIYSENPPIEAFESWFANHRRQRVTKPTARATTSINRSRARRASTLPVSLSTTANFNRGIYSRRSLPPSMKAMSNNPPAISPQAVSSVAALRERLARNREERNAKVAATRNARNTLSMSPHAAVSLQMLSRSPSIAPAEQTVVSLVTPVCLPEVGVDVMREHSVLAVSQTIPWISPPVSTSGTTHNEEMSQTQASTMSQMFGPPQLGPAEWVIGLPLRTKSVTPNGIDQKKAYLDSFVRKHAEIQQFLSSPGNADPALVKTMKDVVETSGRIATHPDLPFDKVGISASAPGKEAEYHAAMSSKFVFLRAFLMAVKGQFLKIVIVAEKGKLIDILEIFLRGLKVCYTRLDRLSMLPRIPDDDLEGLVKVFLLPSCKSGAVTNAADCLIAMDSTFNAELPEIRGFRSNIVEVEKLAPVIRLVAINTVEHLRLCCIPGQEIPLQVYVETLKNLRLQVGIASQEYGGAISRAPTKISKWLQKKAEGALDMPNIPELPLFESTTQPTTGGLMEGNDKRKRQEDNFGTHITDTSVSQPIETKRLRVHDPVLDFSLPVFSQQQGDITHISDSMPSQTMTAEPPEQLGPESENGQEESVSSPMDLESEREDEEEVELGKEEKKVELEDDGVTFVQPTMIPSETGIEFMSREDLVLALKKKIDELQQWMDSTGRLQVRHEELRRTLLEVKKGLKDSQKNQEGVEIRRERMSNELTRLKTERAQLWTDLEQARKRLLAGPPQTAQLEQLRSENEKHREKLRSAENNAQIRERDFDFLRDQYQQASNGAFELRGDNDKLRKEIFVLEKRSGEVVVRLRQLQLGNQVAARDKLIENLSLQLKEREERIARLEHERSVSTRSRGSLGMRASSVSLRGSPIQSRATSPTTGGFHGRESLTHPLRNG